MVEKASAGMSVSVFGYLGVCKIPGVWGEFV